MKKLLYGVLGLILLLVVAVFTLPLLFDVNQYKPVLESQVKTATGYEISMKGALKLTLVPRPKIYVENVSIYNNSKSFITVEEISAFPKISELFHRRIEVDSVRLQKPVMTLVKNEAGNNWVNNGGSGPVSPNAKLAVQIKNVQIVDGKLDYTDDVEKKAYSFSSINLNTGVPSLAGPVSLEGMVMFKDLGIGLKGKIFYADAFKVSLTTTILGSEIFYEGSQNFGTFNIKSADIGPVAEAFELEDIRHLAKMKLDIKGDIARAKDKFDLENMEFTIGDTKGEGDLSLALDDKIEANADLRFSVLSLDQLIPKATPPKEVDPKKEAEAEKEEREIMSDMDVRAETTIYGGVKYKNLNVNATTSDNEVVLEQLRFDFPDSGSTEITGRLYRDTSGRVFEGVIDSYSNNLRNILKSFHVNLDPIKPDMLRNFKLDSQLIVNIRDNISIELPKTSLMVDDNKFAGNISTDVAKVPTISINGTISAVDLDKYLVEEKVENTEKQRETGATDDKPYHIIWLEKLPIAGAVNILVGNFTYKNDSFSKLRLTANFKPEILNIEQIIAPGRRLQLSAKASIFAYKNKKPRIDILDAHIGNLDIADFIKSDESPTPNATDKTRWTKKTFDLSFLRRIDMDFQGNFQSLKHGKLVFKDLDVAGYIEKGQLILKKSEAGFYDGKLSLNGDIEATAVPSINFAYTIKDAEVGKLIEALTGNTKVSGRANLSGSLKTSGIYQQAMISNLGGNITIGSNNLVVRGFDLDAMAGQIVNTNNVADVTSIARTVSGEDAVTYLKTVTGGVVLENGTARTQGKGIQMLSGAGPGVYIGKANFLDWYIDSNAKFQLNTPDGKTPVAGIHIFGSIDDPKKELNLDDVKRYMAARASKTLLDQNPDPVLDTPKEITPETSPIAPPLTKAELRAAKLKEKQAAARARASGWVQPITK